ncbi:hypothetical protein D1631_08610 [Chryseobacterium nematophagum]|uniref:Uncharacterized protein n=2 Tax=Chryseobacterium TaxID=59732 RepID=A0A3M7TEH1_9FLAO|nr:MULTISPECIES: hypothetical protein [Chryseobacterium]RMZ59617.1 hypothetical protein D1632_08280 [Chryseobacterium nematophagum]RNA61992.1 hypothetical protein D1631_08610 [Chryseobacterium nematophagum]CAA7195231.1 hypothetical protein CHRY9293_01460 [Chryseobacterium potabilaquae]
MENTNEVINTGVVAMSSTVPAAIAMQTNSHSVGLMFEQSILNQQRDYQLAIGNSVMSAKKLVAKKVRIKGAVGIRKSRFDI